VEEYLSAYKERIMEILPGSFFTSFWFLTIDSVYFPTKSYQDKIDDLKVNIFLLRKKWSSRLLVGTRKSLREQDYSSRSYPEKNKFKGRSMRIPEARRI